ncbi:helix-turn-helix domain-containing protein [Streptomyces sp. NPDC051940]|uniref:PucR family transcriptional regulator n=1 Tax=Streptomyces sp. NPDC051940 TaxID=3155675 RepID=UPI003423FB8B
MPGPHPSAALAQPPEPLPQEMAAIMRPELPSLITEISREIGRAIPEYSDLLDGPYGRVVQEGIESNLSAFVEHVATPTASTTRRDEMCRKLGRFEAYEGRSFHFLRMALRIGARVSLRRAKSLASRYNLSPTIIAIFADTVFAYIDEIEALCREGYVQAQAEPHEEIGSLRRRLLRLVLAGGSTPAHPAVAELAETAGWPLPDEATPVALGHGRAVDRAVLDEDILIEDDDPQPHLLIPGPVTDRRLSMLRTALTGRRAVIGLTVALSESDDSLRWARRLFALADAGVVERTPVLHSEEHLVTLLLLSDLPLVEELARRELEPLTDLTPMRQERLIDTLRVWLTTRGTAAEIAGELDVHPQTVRYRMRNLGHTFGERLRQPESRFAIEVALRAQFLKEGRGAESD